ENSATAKDVKNLRWVIRDDEVPIIRTVATRFAEQVERESKGRLHVQILNSSEVGSKHGLGLFKKIQAGDIEITHLSLERLAPEASQYWLFDLPFLFKDADHLERVIESDV